MLDDKGSGGAGDGGGGGGAKRGEKQPERQRGGARTPEAKARFSHLRPSLRTNAVLMVLAMLVLPQLIVVGWSLMERDIGGKLQWEAKVSSEEAARVLDDAMGDTRSTETRLNEVAARWGTRIRVVSKEGEILFDVDADRGTDLVHQVGTLFFGPDGAPTLREFDETLGPVPKRTEVLKVTGWSAPETAPPSPLPEGSTGYRYPFGPRRDGDTSSAAPVSTAFRASSPPPPDGIVETGCRTSPAGKLLLCHAARTTAINGSPHVIYAQESSRRAVRALYDLRYHLARLSVVMLPFALIFSWWMGRRMVRPIEWLRERVLEKAKSANPRADIDLRGGDEVRDLAEAFNDLLGALDERRRANEAFVADLVHEFKNPVAAIRACAESLEGGSADEKRAARLAKILADSSGRLDALVSQFLELARAEAGMPKEDRAEVDLGALARGVALAVEPSFEDVRFVIDVPPSPSSASSSSRKAATKVVEDDARDLPSSSSSGSATSTPEDRRAAADLTVIGVSTRLDSLVRNLVDNAASFAGAGGEVRISVQREGNIVALEVSDSGPGIAEGDLPRVFDRFFTTRAIKHTSHAPDRPKGSGLGLALVKAVAEAHGGEVSARSTPSKGATFRVTLPARS